MNKFNARLLRNGDTAFGTFCSVLLRLCVSGLIFPLSALAQCAMCKTTAEAAGEASLAAGLNIGILFLLAPPLAIFCAIFWTAYKSQNPSRPNEHD